MRQINFDDYLPREWVEAQEHAEYIRERQKGERLERERELAAERKKLEAKIAYAKALDIDDRMIEMMIGSAV